MGVLNVLWRGPVKLVRDLLMGPGNSYWDQARVGAALAMAAILASVAWNMLLGLPIDIDKAGIGIGAILTGSAAWVYAKDRRGQ